MNPRKPHIWSIMALGAVLGGCKVGPNYHRPDVPVAPQYKEVPGWTAATPEDKAPKGDWWTDFNDDLLNQLEPMVAVSNQSVRQSYANYQQALAEVKVADAQLFPSIGVTGTVSRARESSTVSSVGANGTITYGKGSSIINSGSVEATASWTPDIWGAVRRLIEENKATAQADEATFANATLSEQTLLATTLIELRMTDAGVDLQQRTVDANQKSLQIVEQQASAGIAATPPSAVITARVAWETAKANLIGLGVARAQYAHAIAVLVGKNPEDLDIPHSTTTPTLPTVPVGVPSTLLQRRPDIASAERTMAAQNATIGIAVAAYFPTVPLSAAAGFSQAPLDGLLHSANEVWSIGASATETLVDFGERHAEVSAAKAAYAAAVANYRQTVLTGFGQVEDNLAALRVLATEAEQQHAATRSAEQTLDLFQTRYEGGVDTYLQVITSQTAALQNERNDIQIQLRRQQASVLLIKALGGGWSTQQLPPV